MPSCDGAGAAERSYPTSQDRGRSREDPMPEGRRPRGATPHQRSRVVAGSSYLNPEARGSSWEEAPTPQAGASGREEQPEERWLSRHRRA